MKIAFVHQPINTMSLANLDDSIAIWTYEVARRLSRFCDVIVYAKKGHTQKKIEHHQGVQYRRVSTVADEKFAHIASAVDKRLTRFCNSKRPLFASRLYYLTFALRVAKNLKSQKCDIVHIQNFSQFVPIIRAINPKIRIVLHMHCDWLTQLDRAMIERRLRKVDLVIGCSEYNTEKIRRAFPQFAKRCQTVYNGVDVNHFVNENGQTVRKENGVKRLLFLGRVSPEKGLHVLLEAFQKVVERYPQAQLEIVGPQRPLPIEFIVALSDSEQVSDLALFYRRNSKRNYFSHLQKQLFSLNIANNVTFTGSIPYRHVLNNYHDASIFVNSSFSESFPLPILEAMASELPVVATRVGGVPEAVADGKTGLLVEAGDVSALAEAIILLLKHEGLRKSMGKAARKRAVELFSWERVVGRLFRWYKNTRDVND